MKDEKKYNIILISLIGLLLIFLLFLIFNKKDKQENNNEVVTTTTSKVVTTSLIEVINPSNEYMPASLNEVSSFVINNKLVSITCNSLSDIDSNIINVDEYTTLIGVSCRVDKTIELNPYVFSDYGKDIFLNDHNLIETSTKLIKTSEGENGYSFNVIYKIPKTDNSHSICLEKDSQKVCFKAI